MTEKTKSKVNSRRRLLIRLVLGIGVIVALVAAVVYLFRPAGAQIVFIAPDENGVDNIWIADLNNPEHPRQLTHYMEVDTWIGRFSVNRNRSSIAYVVYSSQTQDDGEIVLLNLHTLNKRILTNCVDSQAMCNTFSFSTDGRYIAYIAVTQVYDELYQGMYISGLFFYTIDLNDSTDNLIHGIENLQLSIPSSYLIMNWLNNEYQLAMPVSIDPFEVSVYDVENRTFTQNLSADISYEVTFSPDNNYYITRNSQTYLTTIYDIENNNILHFRPEDISWQTDDFYLIGTTSVSWNPDNTHVLLIPMILSPYANDWCYRGMPHILDLATGDLESLFGSEDYTYSSLSWNADATRALYIRRPYHRISCADNVRQLMLYDMETQEETALPLFGHSPQWVNGGR